MENKAKPAKDSLVDRLVKRFGKEEILKSNQQVNIYAQAEPVRSNSNKSVAEKTKTDVTNNRQSTANSKSLSYKEPKMHFRIRENMVQLIRTEYDPATKKPKATIVGRLNRAKPEAISDDIKKALTKEEFTELTGWVAGNLRLQSLKEEMAALSLPDTFVLAEKWFARQKGSDIARTTAGQVVANWQSLRGQLTKHKLLD